MIMSKCVHCAYCERPINLSNDKYEIEELKKYGEKEILYFCEECCKDKELSKNRSFLIKEIKNNFHHRELKHLHNIVSEAPLRGFNTCYELADLVKEMMKEENQY